MTHGSQFTPCQNVEVMASKEMVIVRQASHVAEIPVAHPVSGAEMARDDSNRDGCCWMPGCSAQGLHRCEGKWIQGPRTTGDFCLDWCLSFNPACCNGCCNPFVFTPCDHVMCAAHAKKIQFYGSRREGSSVRWHCADCYIAMHTTIPCSCCCGLHKGTTTPFIKPHPNKYVH